LLSTLPAIATTLAGVIAGRWLQSARSPAHRFRGLALAGAAAMAAGLIWGAWFPINKSLWTSSYALFTAGAAALGLAACGWLVDVAGYRRWTGPFVIFGTNALALFFLSTLGALLLVAIRIDPGDGSRFTLQSLLYRTLFAPWAEPATASLAWALAYLLLWLGVMGLLYRRRIFIRV
jgi:predicted acyltransferase